MNTAPQPQYQHMTIGQAVDTAIAAHQTGQLDAAEQLYHQILRYQPQEPTVLHMLGVLAYQREQWAHAESFIRQSLAIDQNQAPAHCNLASVLQKLKRYDQAESHFKEAIRLQPGGADVYANFGNLLAERGMHDAAIEQFQNALRYHPQHVQALLNMGASYADQNKLGSALDCFRRVLAMDPANAQACNNMGSALVEFGNTEDAVYYYRKALESDANNHEAWCNLGAALLEQGQKEEAMACFKRVPGYHPDFAVPMSNYLFGLHYLPDHTVQSVYPEACAWGREYAPESLRMSTPQNDRNPDRKLRIGYVTADFRNHPVGYFMQQVLQHHDPSQVETHAYVSQKSKDVMTQRLQEKITYWHDVIGEPDALLAERIRRDQIDILVDLSGHSAGNRLRTFAHKPAPVQVSWLGYFGTTGMPAMDYILADAVTIAPEEEAFYTEQVMRLPENYICFSPPSLDIDPGPLPLKNNGYVTFACFNKVTKIVPEVFDAWAEIMQAMPRSHMLLKSRAFESEEVRRRISNEFSTRGVAADRLLLELHSPREDYLKTFQRVDMVLDTFPYSGGTTTAEALWMGVPVVTKRGKSFAGRIGASLLHHAGFGDLVCSNKTEYVSKAIMLARDGDAQASLRARMRNQLLASPVCDGARFTRHLEAAYRTMWQRWCQTASE